MGVIIVDIGSYCLISVYSGVYWLILLYIGLYWCILIYFGVRRFIFVYRRYLGVAWVLHWCFIGGTSVYW